MSESDDDISSLHGLGPLELPVLAMKHALLNQKVMRLVTDLAALKEEMKDDYAQKSDLDALSERVKLPIAMVYATAGLILVTVIGALVALVVKGHGP